MVSLASLCESYLADGHDLDLDTVPVLATLVRSHNLWARAIPPVWATRLLQRVRVPAFRAGLRPEARQRQLDSLVAALQLVCLTIAESGSEHVAAHARNYFNALAGAWQHHDDVAVRTLAANGLEGLLRRSYSCASDFQNMLKAQVLPKLQMIFGTRSRAVQLRFHQKLDYASGSKSKEEESSSKSAAPLLGHGIGFQRHVLRSGRLGDADVTALLHSVLSLAAAAFSKFSRTLKALAHKAEVLGAVVLTLSPMVALQEAAAALIAALPHTSEMWSSLMARTLNSFELQVCGWMDRVTAGHCHSSGVQKFGSVPCVCVWMTRI